MLGTSKVCVTIEARMTSSRLPGKVLLPLAGEPALKRMLDRVKPAEYVDEIVVATTTNPEDDPIVALCERDGTKYFRGSEDDVLSRVLESARSVGADIIVELTGDCPLVDHRHIGMVIDLFARENCDYASNTHDRGTAFPNGFDVQVFPVRVLEEVDALTDDPIDRVHVSYYIYTHPERFSCASLVATDKMCWPELEVTLDEEGDYDLLNAIFSRLLPTDPLFSAEAVIDLLKAHPELLEINAGVRRKAPQEG